MLKQFTKQEDAYIIKFAKKKTYAEIASDLERPTNSVRQRSHKLGATTPLPKPANRKVTRPDSKQKLVEMTTLALHAAGFDKKLIVYILNNSYIVPASDVSAILNKHSNKV